MSHRLLTAFLFAGVLLHNTPVRAAADCEELRKLSMVGAEVTATQRVAAGAFAPPVEPGAAAAPRSSLFAKLPAFCRVMITAKPSSDSDIKIEVWLPASGWNGKYQAVGDGGLAGFIPFALMAPALADGYATSGTDTGHVGGNANFMPGHPKKLLDFAYRSTHEMAKAGKTLIVAYYGKPPAWSYYNACSGGGRHALASAQRYPDDFQGLVAGAPSWNQARLDAGRIGINLTVNQTSESRIPESKYPMIHNAVMQACDKLDGVSDGVIENPRACKFDYSALLCKGADSPSCLTAPQVESARTLTSPFRDSVTGRVLLEAHLRPGSELQWATLGSPTPIPNSLARVRNFHLKDPSWEFRLENVTADIDRAVRMDNGLLASDNFNLKPFFDRGGKLLMWHGWSDPQVPAENSILYFNNVSKTVGSAAQNSIALFMLPGVLHCRGGSGPDAFDKMAAITRWVEQGQKPASMMASRATEGKVTRTRTLCPFPQVAKYSGVGDTNDAANFTCVAESASGTSQH